MQGRTQIPNSYLINPVKENQFAGLVAWGRGIHTKFGGVSPTATNSWLGDYRQVLLAIVPPQSATLPYTVSNGVYWR